MSLHLSKSLLCLHWSHKLVFHRVAYFDMVWKSVWCTAQIVCTAQVVHLHYNAKQKFATMNCKNQPLANSWLRSQLWHGNVTSTQLFNVQPCVWMISSIDSLVICWFGLCVFCAKWKDILTHSLCQSSYMTLAWAHSQNQLPTMWILHHGIWMPLLQLSQLCKCFGFQNCAGKVFWWIVIPESFSCTIPMNLWPTNFESFGSVCWQFNLHKENFVQQSWQNEAALIFAAQSMHVVWRDFVSFEVAGVAITAKQCCLDSCSSICACCLERFCFFEVAVWLFVSIMQMEHLIIIFDFSCQQNVGFGHQQKTKAVAFSNSQTIMCKKGVHLGNWKPAKAQKHHFAFIAQGQQLSTFGYAKKSVQSSLIVAERKCTINFVMQSEVQSNFGILSEREKATSTVFEKKFFSWPDSHFHVTSASIDPS